MKMELTMQQMRKALTGQCNTQSVREVEHYTEHYLFRYSISSNTAFHNTDLVN